MQKNKKIICNRCKKILKMEKGYLKEGCFQVDYLFGYFSNKDGIRHRFDLCEDCYDAMISEFSIPVEEVKQKEFL